MMKRSGRRSSSRITEDAEELAIVDSVVEYDSERGFVTYSRVVFSGCLHPMPRARASRRGHVYLPHGYKRYVAALKSHLSGVWDGFQWQPPYRLVVRVYKPYSPMSARYGDADNLLKTVMDVLPFDDIWVSEASVGKYIGEDFGFKLELRKVELD